MLTKDQHLGQDGLASFTRIFESARTHSAWLPSTLPDSLLRAIYERARFGPTSLNCQPMRVVFVRSAEGKERLRKALNPGNVEKTMAAPATAIVAYDLDFHSNLPKLLPHRDARSLFTDDPTLALETAFRNSTLQGAYLMMAARSFGVDVGPMSGFDHPQLDAEFFADTRIFSNFLVNLGHGDASKLRPRNERLAFDEACRLE